MRATMLDPDFIRRLVSYNPETGILYWNSRTPDMFVNPSKCSQWNTRYAGKEALPNVDNNGYKRGSIMNMRVLAHRAIWTIYHGEAPNGPIDHINGDRIDNRIVNLRMTDVLGNNRNAALRKDNSSGVSGVRFRNGKYSASVRNEGKKVHLGVFLDLSSAKESVDRYRSNLGYSTGHGTIRALRKETK